ncbi:MAG TPA: DUF4160 domain-containing protein, partial [Beijerinckiaceae bacterium]|nr:DUF4160 domain-containing protein [Beijerinckiaceae bacterium]
GASSISAPSPEVPTVFREGPYRVFFYSADCEEPAHVHIQREARVAKLWMHDLTFAKTGGFAGQELAHILGLGRTRRKEIMERWNEHCRG